MQVLSLKLTQNADIETYGKHSTEFTKTSAGRPIPCVLSQ